ncbi:creatininase family protein [Haloferax sp. ATB1]|uniref:creatininase family protein n=1 Tax=Haloferax sp. ATB1 TaxID=1508454 RepID=UPI0005B22D9D|nr:creatininase family protein [Haloferax sp. ATB1]
MNLTAQTWVDVEEPDVDVCLLPVGSVEQHGPHAPLGTDVFVADAIAEAAAGRVEAWKLPPVHIGVAPYHRHFPGTLHLPPEVLREYVFHLLKCIDAWGVETVLIINGHGGNRDALKHVCRRLSDETGLDAQYWEWMKAVEADVQHAGAVETSVLQHLVPELLGTPQPGDAESWGEWVHGAQTAMYTDEFSENGVVGDPTAATAEAGQDVFETAVGELQELIAWLGDRNAPENGRRRDGDHGTR